MQTLKMGRQPSWPEGQEPDKLTNIKGGFSDGWGQAFPVPVGRKGSVSVRRDQDGAWHWAIEPQQ